MSRRIGAMPQLVVATMLLLGTNFDTASITLTAIWDINPRGQFVGTYMDATGRHGFLQNPDDSAPLQIDVPGQTGTIVFGINPEGVLVGSYSIGSQSHGFMAIPVPADRILAAHIEEGR